MVSAYQIVVLVARDDRERVVGIVSSSPRAAETLPTAKYNVPSR
jgi:hypothetical protein